MKSILELETGEKFEGYNFGNISQSSGEIVFQTGITGYPETITDPSYAGQFIVFTTPLINNYGFPKDIINEYDINESVESNKPQCKAIIVQEYTKNSSHYNAQKSFEDWLIKNKVVALEGIDTRLLTKIIRENGICKARIYQNEIIKPDFIDIGMINLVRDIVPKTLKTYGDISNPKILFFDCGAKNSQLTSILKRNLCLDRVPYDYEIELSELEKYAGIFISNGPGNPEQLPKLIGV